MVVVYTVNKPRFSVKQMRFQLKFCDRNRAIERGSLSKFPNINSSVSFSNKLLEKIDHTMNETAVLQFMYIFSDVI